MNRLTLLPAILKSSIAFVFLFGADSRGVEKSAPPVVISDVFRIAQMAAHQTMQNPQAERKAKEENLCELYSSLFYFIHDNNFGNHPELPSLLIPALEAYLLEYREAIRSKRADNIVSALTTLVPLNALVEESGKSSSEEFPEALRAFLEGGPYPLPTNE